MSNFQPIAHYISQRIQDIAIVKKANRKLISGKIVLMHVFMPKTNTLNIYDVLVHNFMTLSLHYCCYEQNDLRFVSQGRVRTAISRDGQLWCSFVASLREYLCATNYQTTTRFDTVIAKIKKCNFFCLSVQYRLAGLLAIGKDIP